MLQLAQMNATRAASKPRGRDFNWRSIPVAIKGFQWLRASCTQPVPIVQAVTAAMRKVISLTGAVALFSGAAYWLYFTSYKAAWYPLWFLVGFLLLTLLAAYWWWEHYVSPWLSRTSTRKSQFAKDVDEHVRVMLTGFEPRLFEVLNKRVNVDVLVTESERVRMSAQACAIYAAAALLDRAVERLGKHGRSAVLEAFEQKNETNKMYVGLSRMMATVDRFDVEASLKRMLLYGVIGRLKGVSREQIHSWWLGSEGDRVADGIERDPSALKYLEAFNLTHSKEYEPIAWSFTGGKAGISHNQEIGP